MTSCQARLQAWAIDGYWPPQSASNASSASRRPRRCRRREAWRRPLCGHSISRQANACTRRRARDRSSAGGAPFCTVVSGKAELIASGKPFRPSTTAIRMSWNEPLAMAVPELVHHRQPELGAVVGQIRPLDGFVTPPTLSDPEAEHLALAVAGDTERQIDRIRHWARTDGASRAHSSRSGYPCP